MASVSAMAAASKRNRTATASAGGGTEKETRLVFHSAKELRPETFFFAPPRPMSLFSSIQKPQQPPPPPPPQAQPPQPPPPSTPTPQLPHNLRAECVLLPSRLNKDGLRCDWDHHAFDGPVVGLPFKYDAVRNAYHLTGRYCSFACAKASALASNNHRLAATAPFLLTRMLRQLLGPEAPHGVKAAPHWKTLRAYGGPWDIDEFRRQAQKTPHSTDWAVVAPYDMQVPLGFALTRDSAEMRLTGQYALVNRNGGMVPRRMYNKEPAPAGRQQQPPGRVLSSGAAASQQQLGPPSRPRKNASHHLAAKSHLTMAEARILAQQRSWFKPKPPGPGVVLGANEAAPGEAERKPSLPPPPPPLTNNKPVADPSLEAEVDALRRRKRLPPPSSTKAKRAKHA
jgi:hypothetical protein